MKHAKLLLHVSLILCGFLIPPTLAAGPKFGGTSKVYAVGLFAPDRSESTSIRGREDVAEFQTSFRIQGTWEASRLYMEAAYEATPIFTVGNEAPSTAGTLLTPPDSSLRLIDFNSLFGPTKQSIQSSYAHNLDRFSVQATLPAMDLIVGRQAITFGVARAVRPLDVLIPFGTQTLNQEFRAGVDAIRMRFELGEFSELDAGYVPGKHANWEESVFYGRLRTHVAKTDCVFMTMALKKALLLGGALSRGIGPVGTWLEIAYVDPKRESAYVRLTVGVDRTLAENLLASLEYHYNQSGTTKASHYLAQLSRFPAQKGGVILLGRHYLAMQTTWTVTPILSVSIQTMINTTDPSALLQAQTNISLSDNWMLDLGGHVAIGETPSDNWDLASSRSEFGSYPHLLFVASRYYF